MAAPASKQKTNAIFFINFLNINKISFHCLLSDHADHRHLDHRHRQVWV